VVAWLERERQRRAWALRQPPAPPPKKQTIRVQLWLRVERNSKFVRGKKRAREEIEDEILARYNMEKPDNDGYVYILTIPYDTDEELDEIIHKEILVEAERIADLRHCFTESDVTAVDDPDRSW
jgi:hypothetical protein